MGPRMKQGPGMEPMGSNILHWNVYTSLRQEQGPELIVSYWASPIPLSIPSPGLVQCE